MEEKKTRKNARKEMVETPEIDTEMTLDIDNSELQSMSPVQPDALTPSVRRKYNVVEKSDEDAVFVNCLRNERIVVKHINRPSSISDPRHVCYGRMHENSKVIISTPITKAGVFKNVLTNDEKNYLERILGLEPNALSVYKRENNFWDDSDDTSMNTVILTKQDTILDLSIPADFIKYKILLANSNIICPSYEEFQDRPKATYLYYLTSEDNESKMAVDNFNKKSLAYMKLGELGSDRDKMRVVLELLTGRPTAKNSNPDTLKVELSKNIEGNAKDFLKIISDPLLDTKTLIKRAVEEGILTKSGNWYRLKSDNSPLCEPGEEPTFNIAAKYLNNPKRQDLLFSIQAKLKD